MNHQKIIIVGAGMIGLSMALGLRQQGHQVDVIERGSRPEYGQEPELRVSALAHHSRDLLQQLGVWQQLPSQRLGPYTAMDVWDHDSFGRIEFAANEVNADDLGAIVENRVLEQVLWDAALQAGVTIHAGEAVAEHNVTEQQVSIRLVNGQKFYGDYLIAADGNRSTIRERARLPLSFWDYQQTGIVAVINTELPHQGIARQVFLPSGPIAWLPLNNPHQVSLVWSADTELAEQLQALDDKAFMQRLQAASDSCLGQLQLASQRAGFPLRMQYAQRWLQQRLMVIGDAAHSIHPLAGQGANLGFGDVIDLLQVFANQPSHKSLRAWERQRKAAAVTMITAMEAFKHGFGSANPLLKLARGVGFQVANNTKPLKRMLVKAALGE
ncbi:UbiH/UbiF/VisC/COQ6 family ubiquinone biosynthesis hydroxylase [Pseudidiomarina donghaiensis]|uniref:Ubiquinone biosynthesis protein UbiH n=1 Tax=Pseudidiomarina donghaiensis TaxID=519452 RepID=A0A432XFT4_9GAMM|nr:UbiH/UbiF/VisC/COQ6 family ubiquinone biosynthesis hydroxylase [Pseudidiomarina donghaiensis]RUO47530.1 ubiquinone biosynthesis protein UbiH [Pseudidiomarina donghaiensis]SFV23255.1 2-octaprenylphenol hydroxylase [Pseudidiomarina donghaiensis]